MNDATTMGEGFRRVGFDVRGGRMAGIALGPETENPDIVFLHATGFNARTYRSMLAPLGDRFHVLALDARGHGRTTLSTSSFGYNSWTRHRDDVIAVLEKYLNRPMILAGHSMGATVSALVATRRPDLVAGVALFEPVILPAPLRALLKIPGGPLLARHFSPFMSFARKRRGRFDDRESAVRALTGRGVFKTFPAEALQDYVADGLVDDAQGGMKLVCTPDFEAKTYSAQRHNPRAALLGVQCPMVLLRGEYGTSFETAEADRLAARKPEARVAFVDGATHMLPIERPDRARAAIEAAALMAGKTWEGVE
jgi:pimeloyl-ACP methyl ester carboxylesterase